MGNLRQEVEHTLEGIAHVQGSQGRLMLTMLPLMVFFIALGTHWMIALLASSGIAIPLFLAWEARQARICGESSIPEQAYSERGIVIGMTIPLLMAVGAQTVIWAKGLTGNTADHFVNTVFGILLGVVMSIIALAVAYDMMQILRGKKVVDCRRILSNAAFIGILGALPIWLIALILFHRSDSFSAIVYIAFALIVGWLGYRRLHQIHMAQHAIE
ncbi:MAG: hypothetical protein HGA19_19995 [Oscillochloris sp.]|nr:hypothetical protein [Oscillochloris sp.]